MNSKTLTVRNAQTVAFGLSSEQVRALTIRHGSPLYVYSKTHLRDRARQLINLELPFGLTVRYAVKANPHPTIVTIFDTEGLHFDASSSYEALRLLEQGVAGDKISLSSQQPAHNIEYLLQAGVRFTATSMHQLELLARAAKPGTRLALRVNAGVGSGHNNRTKTAGRTSSFGLWHEYLDNALNYAREHELIIDRLHTHIGSGADPAVWEEAMATALDIADRMPDVKTLNIGGGYKVRRFAGEAETDMQKVAAVFAAQLSAFASRTGRQLHLEIEPGTWLVAHAGFLAAEIIDIVDTGKSGFSFLRINTGMNDFLRPTLYGARHKIVVLNDAVEQSDYVVVGHNCETGDILTTAPGDPETIEPRTLNRATIGDLLLVEDAGAYCAAMSAKGYNSYPDAQEIFV
jgi:diaminopimelate decarboxylase